MIKGEGGDPTRKQSLDTPLSPAHVEVASANIDGVPSRRLMLVFKGLKGCSHALDGAGCTYCGFGKREINQGGVVDPEVVTGQFFQAVKKHDFEKEGIQELDLYMAGSFLSDEEMPPVARESILRESGAIPGLKQVLIESRPEFITGESVAGAKEMLGDKKLSVGMGLESADDYLRETVLNKGFSKVDYEKAVGVLAKGGVDVLTYVLLKPTTMEEVAAIQDVVNTVRYIKEVSDKCGINDGVISLSPTFVPAGTKLFKEFEMGKYQPPTLWSLVEALKQIHNLSVIRVGLSEEGLACKGGVAKNCGKCDDMVKTALEEFNRTQNIGVFDGLDCDCRKK